MDGKDVEMIAPAVAGKQLLLLRIKYIERIAHRPQPRHEAVLIIDLDHQQWMTTLDGLLHAAQGLQFPAFDIDLDHQR